MVRGLKVLGAAVLGLAAMAGATQAQRPVWEQSGTLNCDVSAGIGFIIGSQRQVNCLFTPSYPAPPQQYVGTITKVGLQISPTPPRPPPSPLPLSPTPPPALLPA